MTLTNMTQFSQHLQNQMTTVESGFDMTPSAPIFKLLHPALVKLQIDPHSLAARSLSHGVYYQSLSSDTGQVLIKGFPFQVWKFLQNSGDNHFDFAPVGKALLSKVPLASENQNQHLTAWLDYALSPELWGPEGKWSRFHHKLHGLFSTFDLLNMEAIPGFYPLKTKAQILEKHGFKGELTEHGYNLILAWDFSLTGLNKLENVLKMEF